MTVQAVLPKSAAELFGVRPSYKNARDRLLAKSIDLFYSRGFNAIGLDQVLREVGVTKTTFYKHFESREDLIIAALEQRDHWESLAWRRAVRKVAGAEPRAQLLGIFDVLDIWFNDPDFGGCIFLNAAAEFPDPRDPIHKAAAEHKQRARDEWRDLARAAGAKDADTFADLYTALFEGTLILRHVHHRADAAKITKPMAEHLINQYIPPPKPDMSVS
jgi:AcrR family transcriptional regulator